MFSKNTHVLRNHTRGVGGSDTHESEWMRSGRRDMNGKEEEGRQRQENLVPGLKQSLSAGRRETGVDGVELPGGRKEGRQAKRGERSSHNRTGGNGAIEQEESVHAATGSSTESSQVFVGACADVGEPRASSHLSH